MNYFAIIVAGGVGTRLCCPIPKQFLVLIDKPVLFYSLEAFYQVQPSIRLVVVLPENFFNTWKNLCQEYNFHIPHQVVAGGDTRFQSVQNGLHACSEAPDDALIAIHDAARPLVSTQIITEGFSRAATYGTAIPVIPVKESIRRITEHSNEPLRRHEYFLVQTPQFFRMNLIRTAYQTPYRTDFTDDASVVQYAGHPVHTFEGDPHNIKITYPLDLDIASAILTGTKQA